MIDDDDDDDVFAKGENAISINVCLLNLLMYVYFLCFV
jgi:hypothetical protein